MRHKYSSTTGASEVLVWPLEVVRVEYVQWVEHILCAGVRGTPLGLHQHRWAYLYDRVIGHYRGRASADSEHVIKHYYAIKLALGRILRCVLG